VLLHIR